MIVSLGDKLNVDLFGKQVTETFRRSRNEYAKQIEESIQSKVKINVITFYVIDSLGLTAMR